MRLGELLGYTEILKSGVNLDQRVNQITYDSRQVEPGTIFVAITGYKTDGHRYIPDALQRGAVCVVIQDPEYGLEEYPWVLVANTRIALADLSCSLYGFPGSQLNIIGVTGTNGKTTTTNLITSILEESGQRTGLIGTIHNRIGSEIIPVHHTTPEAPDLQGVFLNFLGKGARYVVMEVSSHALDLHRVRGTEFDIAVFTNLTQDHLDFHGSMEQYLGAKCKLFSGLGLKGEKQRRKFGIINADDPYAAYLIEMTSVPVITYGVNNQADVKAEQVRVTADGVSYLLKYTDRLIPVSLKLTGLFNVYNSLAAIATCLVEGISADSIVASLEKIPGIPGRFERVRGEGDFTVIVDYSHTPDSLENCLKTAREFAEERIITVFGCGGDRDKTKRPIMGEVAAKLSDFCIITSDNPRSEDPQAIIQDIIPGVERVMGPQQYTTTADRREAIYLAVREARPRDVVIIAGKGHEDYQIIGGQVLPFDDRIVAREAMEAKGRK